MPGATDDGDRAIPLAPRGADRLTHVCLTTKLAEVVHLLDALPNFAHRFKNRREQVSPIATSLHDVLPPSFAVVEPSRLGEHLQGVDSFLGRCVFFRLIINHPELMGHGQIHEPRGDLMIDGVFERLPLRREHREWIIDRFPRLVWSIHENGDRRAHLRVAEKRDHRVSVGRTFHEHNVWLNRSKRVADTPGRPRAVMANAQDMERYRCFGFRCCQSCHHVFTGSIGPLARSSKMSATTARPDAT